MPENILTALGFPIPSLVLAERNRDNFLFFTLAGT